MLDTNTLSDLIDNNHNVKAHLARRKPEDIVMSMVTKAELLYGLANQPDSTRLLDAVQQALGKFRAMSWDDDAAEAYGRLKADLKAKGLPLSELDMMIASHCIAAGSVLVTSDKAFSHVQ